MRRRRVALLTLAFLVAGCTTQATFRPSPPGTPVAQVSPSPTPTPLNLSNDVLYVLRNLQNPDPQAGSYVLDVIDARTGAQLDRRRGGTPTADGKYLVRHADAQGGTATDVQVVDAVTGAAVRSMRIGSYFEDLVGRVLPDADVVVLQRHFGQGSAQVSRFAVADTLRGASKATRDLEGPFWAVALSPDRRYLYLSSYGGVDGPGTDAFRVYDLDQQALLPADRVKWDPPQLTYTGDTTPFTAIPSSGLAFSIRTYSDRGAYLLALDTTKATLRALRLPAGQPTNDGEKYMLWSLLPTADGATLYAVNPALGVIDEIDARTVSLRRSSSFEVVRGPDGGLMARLIQAIFPVAEAKRYLRSGALLAPDGWTIYAVGTNGIAAIDTATLSLRPLAVPRGTMIDSLALSADGERLYAIDDSSSTILILDPRTGENLGRIRLTSFVESIVRIQTP